MSNPDKTLSREVLKIARELAGVDSRVSSIERTAQGRYRSISGGATTYYDSNGTPILIIGEQTPGGGVAVIYANGPIPPAPNELTATPTPGGIKGRWDGRFVGGVPPNDYAYIEVHATIDPLVPVDASPTTLITTLNSYDPVEFSMQAINRLYASHRVWLVTRSLAGKFSDPGNVVTIVPDYVQPTDIDPDWIEGIQLQLNQLAADVDTINEQNRTFIQSEEPNETDNGNIKSGDIWYETDSSGTIIGTHEWDDEDGAWHELGSAAAGGPFTTIFYQSTAPTDANQGDVWYDDDGLVHYCTVSGTAATTPATWVSIEDQNAIDTATADAIAAAAADATAKAAAAQAAAIAVADTKNTIFRQDGIPTSLAIGDIWFDTDDDNKIYQAKSVSADAITTGEWEPLLVGSAAIADDAITSDKIFAGTIVTTDLAATAIDGMTITGATFQTETTPARGIKINSAGLAAYTDGTIPGGPAAGTAMLAIDSATGSIAMRGSLTAGSDVSGATVTGGTIQTEATANRGAKITSAGLTYYTSVGDGTYSLNYNSASGVLDLKGPIIANGTITAANFQTTGTADRGLKISSTGMTVYSNGTVVGLPAAGVATFDVNGATGAITATGPIFTSADISGSTVTGGLFQTSSESTEGIKINSTAFIAYDDNDNATVVINALTGAVDLRGKLTSTSLASLDNLSIQGTNNYIPGTLRPTSTLPNPVAPITLGYDHVAVSVGLPTGAAPHGSTYIYRGLCPHHSDSNLLVTSVMFLNAGLWGYDLELWSINKTTGAASVMVSTDTSRPGYDADFYAGVVDSIDEITFVPWGGLAMASGHYYAYGSGSGGGGFTTIRRFSATTWALAEPEYVTTYATGQSSAMGMIYDSSQAPSSLLLIGLNPSTPTTTYRVTRFGLTGTLLSTTDHSGFTTSSVNAVLGGQFDFGTGTHYFMNNASNTLVLGFSSNMTAETSNTFGSPAATPPISFAWDQGPTGDTSTYTMWTFSNVSGPKLYRHGTNPRTEYIRAAYAWHDSNATNSTHTSLVGTSAASVTRFARTRLTVSTPPAPQSGLSSDDAANMTKLYAQTALSLSAADALPSTALRLQDQTKFYGSASQDAGYSGVDGSNNTITTWQIIERVKTGLRTNLITNPSFETDTTGWTAGAATTIARTTAQAAVGAASLSLTKITSSGSATAAMPTGTSAIPVAAGETVTAQARFRAATVGRTCTLYISCYDSSGAHFSTTGANATDNTSGWTTVSHTRFLPIDTAYVSVSVDAGFGLAGVGEVHYVDAVMLERASTLDTYFDGSTSAGGGVTYAWTGTANLSTSTATSGTVPETTNGFLTVATVGQIESNVFTSPTQGWQLKGDGQVEIGTFKMNPDGSSVLGRYLADTGWITPTLLNGWAAYGGGWTTPAYRKVNGFVKFKGLIASGTTTINTTIFQLPAGFRPEGDTHMLVLSSGPSPEAGTLHVYESGDVKFRSGGNGYYSLDDVIFIADN